MRKPDKDSEFDRRSVEVCRQLKDVYQRISLKRGTAFAAASDHVHADAKDSEHRMKKGIAFLRLLYMTCLRE